MVTLCGLVCVVRGVCRLMEHDGDKEYADLLDNILIGGTMVVGIIMFFR